MSNRLPRGYHRWSIEKVPDTGKRRWRRQFCLDCARDTYKLEHYYMVRDKMWAAAGMKPDGGMLCLDCLQHRLGYRLKLSDFTAISAAKRVSWVLGCCW